MAKSTDPTKVLTGLRIIGTSISTRVSPRSCTASATYLSERKLAEGFIPHWVNNTELAGAQKINSLPKSVFSTTLNKSPWGERVETVGGEVKDVVEALKAKDGGDIITYGCGETAQKLVAAGLVNELLLMVDPGSLGGGTSLFTTRMDYELVNVRPFPCDLNLALYRPKK